MAMDDFQEALLKEIQSSNERQDKMESTLATFAEHMQHMAVTMERIGVVQEKLEEDARLQREVDDKQNIKIDQLKEDFHTLDKNISSVLQIPKELVEIKKRLAELEKYQGKGENNWGIVKFVVNKFLLPVVALLAIVWAYIKDSV